MADNDVRNCLVSLLIYPIIVIFIGILTGSLTAFGVGFVIFAFVLGAC